MSKKSKTNNKSDNATKTSDEKPHELSKSPPKRSSQLLGDNSSRIIESKSPPKRAQFPRTSSMEHARLSGDKKNPPPPPKKPNAPTGNKSKSPPRKPTRPTSK